MPIRPKGASPSLKQAQPRSSAQAAQPADLRPTRHLDPRPTARTARDPADMRHVAPRQSTARTPRQR